MSSNPNESKEFLDSRDYHSISTTLESEALQQHSRGCSGHTHNHGHNYGHNHGHDHSHNHDTPQDEDALESQHFAEVLRAHRLYCLNMLNWVQRKQQYYEAIPKAHRDMMPSFLSRLDKMRECIRLNGDFLHKVAKPMDNGTTFEEPQGDAGVAGMKSMAPQPLASNHIVPDPDLDKVKSIMKQVVRDWSTEGAAERERCYKPLIDEVQSLFASPSRVRILVPGSGLGRLPWELANMGYDVQGNEFSYYMLLTSFYILNNSSIEGDVVYPFVHQTNNQFREEDMVRPIRFPDVNTSSIPEGVDFSMAAGDFLEIYGKDHEAWDCLATCFFIDTAHNIVDYVKLIYQMLKPGGWWVNIGPLLYHFADMRTELSIELTLEEVETVIKSVGFEYERIGDIHPCPYTWNQKSMWKVEYDCIQFRAKKPQNARPAVQPPESST